MMQSIPNFHDGYLTGILVEKAGATIYVQRVDGVDFKITLVGLEALQADDFRQGNIISNIEIVVGQTPYKHIEFDRLFPPPHPDAAAQFHEAHALFLAGQKARIESGEVSLVVIVPSYGADLLAICREVTCHPG